MTVLAAPYQWQADRYGGDIASRRAPSRVASVAVGSLLAIGLPTAAWFGLIPPTTVETRFVADSPSPAGRAALAEAALRLASARSVITSLGADSLVVTVTDQDAERAREMARSMATTILDLALTPATGPMQGAAPAAPVERQLATSVTSPTWAERARLQASLDAADARLGALSTALTGIARDLAAGARVSPERKGGREALDKATVALADLQLQRIQLQSRYQDDFPAVAALDGQIRSVRAFIGEETRRVDAASRAVPDPGDPILTAERDRLRAEQSQWLDRRGALVTELTAVARLIADEAKTQPRPPAPATTLAPATIPAPLLMEAATTVASGPDYRWWAVPVAAGCGLLVLLIGWIAAPLRSRADRAELLLRHLEGLLAQNPALSNPQTETMLESGTNAALVLNPFREQVGARL